MPSFRALCALAAPWAEDNLSFSPQGPEDGAKGRPQRAQKRSPNWQGEPQEPQSRLCGSLTSWPHLGQNTAPVGRGLPQRTQ